MEEVGANDFTDLFPRLKELKTKEILLRQQEEQQAILTQTNTKLRDRLEKAETALE